MAKGLSRMNEALVQSLAPPIKEKDRFLLRTYG
jgi:hypothetical protein